MRMAVAGGTGWVGRLVVERARELVVDLTAASVAGEAMVTDRVVVRHGQAVQSPMLKLLSPDTVHASMAAPVQEAVW